MRLSSFVANLLTKNIDFDFILSKIKARIPLRKNKLLSNKSLLTQEAYQFQLKRKNPSSNAQGISISKEYN